MFHTHRTRRTRAALVFAASLGSVALLAGCSTSSPISSTPAASASAEGTDGPIVIGSQAYYSNEIIAEIYAQALEGAGMTVERQFNIGQRDAYLPSLESGAIALFPEYTGNLLQYFDPETTARSPEDVYKALAAALPANLAVLDQSTATDQDSYTVTKATADKYKLTSIEDLAKVTDTLTLGGNPELADRPYGPKGLKSSYGVTVEFKATGDTTVDELIAGTIDMADVYTADPRIQTDNLVSLTDPKALFLASNVVPLVNKDLAPKIADVINPVSAKLTPEGLVSLNVLSTTDKKSAEQIATQWLKDNGLL